MTETRSTTTTTTGAASAAPAAPTALGLGIALLAAACFGLTGAFVKPLLESGWSPGAAVTVRALVGALVLAPFAILALRGRWDALWRSRRRVLTMALVGVAGTQLVYFAAIERIPVGTAVLIEYMAPLLLVALAWVTTRRMPKVVVLVGSVVAFLGLALVVAPSGGASLDPLGLMFAGASAVGCAWYYLLAAQPNNGVPPVAFAAASILLAAVILGLVGLLGFVPFTFASADVVLFGGTAPWWVPLLVVGVLATGVAYVANITSTEMLGSRIASFIGLLEVVFATVYAWLLLGEQLTVLQILGGALILTGIVLVRWERSGASEPSRIVGWLKQNFSPSSRRSNSSNPPSDSRYTSS